MQKSWWWTLRASHGTGGVKQSQLVDDLTPGKQPSGYSQSNRSESTDAAAKCGE